MYSFDFSGFVDILCIRLEKKNKLKWCKIIGLTVLTFKKEEMLKKKKKRKKTAWLSCIQCTCSSLMSLAHLKKKEKGGSSVNDCILLCCLIFYVCLYILTLEPLYFSTKKTGPNIFIVQS